MLYNGFKATINIILYKKKNIAVNINTSIKCLILDVAGPKRHKDVQTNCHNAYARFSIYLQRLDVYIEPKTSKNEHYNFKNKRPSSMNFFKINKPGFQSFLLGTMILIGYCFQVPLL